MKKSIYLLLIVLVLLTSTFTSTLAKAPQELSISVHNRTGASVQFNYTGTDQIIHWATIPTGVSTLTLDQDVYQYWADPQCGHIAGSLNLDTSNKILWLTCDDATPAVFLTKPDASCPDQGFYVGYLERFYSMTFWQGTLNSYYDELVFWSYYAWMHVTQGCITQFPISPNGYYTFSDLPS